MIKNQKNRGLVLVQVLVFAVVAVVTLTGLIGWAGANIKASRESFYREQAFEIAEAGIEYYRWHLAHNPTDFQDGTGASGPYIHAYYDKDGVRIGQFELTITSPPVGSTIVDVKSKGLVDSYPSVYRKIEAKFAKPSFAKYAFVTNTDVAYGNGDIVYGPIHTNGGVAFYGTAIAYNTVSSALTTYNDPDHSGSNEWAVHTHKAPVDPLPPTALPTRSDVFTAGRFLPVPVVDFNGITSDLSSIKTNAQASGFYRSGSGGLGYLVVLKTNDTFDLYKVTALVAVPSNCTNVYSQSGWGTWSVNTKTLLGNYAIPANGLIFLEDHVWVEGQINSARVTIGAGTFPASPATYKNIIVNNNLTYTNYDGQDVISLIAQGSFYVGYVSADNLRIDGAIIAQNGAAVRFYYQPASSGKTRCNAYASRSSLTTYGMTASNQRAYFAYSDGNGYATQPAYYDANLLYGPPPSFPLVSDQYQTISWQEIR